MMEPSEEAPVIPENSPGRYYITTAIPYVNALPHIGFALEIVQTDAFARYHRLLEEDTHFLTGTDENSLKNVLAAEREGIPVRALIDRYASVYVELTRVLDISNDDFIRTAADPRHGVGARAFWEACDRNDDIYKQTYVGLYCVGCEQFYTEEELADGRCPEHGTVPEWVEEENYFFRLSRYGNQLAELIDSGRLRIIPETRRNEVRSFIAQGLQDFSISRSRGRAREWGIEVPGDPTQVMYVWFDALTNYITALGYGSDPALYQRYWVENPERVHVIGKGITRFHAVYWPAMLLSAGQPVPATIFVHGYLTVGGAKISKSLGNVIDPLALASRYGADPLRYWLLRGVPPTEDTDFTIEKFERRYNADLANDLGNLLQRTVSMIHRYRKGRIPEPGAAEDVDRELQVTASDVAGRIHTAMGEDYDPQSGLTAIWDLVVRANRYVEQTSPWVLAKAARAGDTAADQRLDTVLFHLAESLRLTAQALRPFLPSTAERMAEQLGVSLGTESWVTALGWGRLTPGTQAAEAHPIFPKLDIAEPVE